MVDDHQASSVAAGPGLDDRSIKSSPRFYPVERLGCERIGLILVHREGNHVLVFFCIVTHVWALRYPSKDVLIPAPARSGISSRQCTSQKMLCLGLVLDKPFQSVPYPPMALLDLCRGQRCQRTRVISDLARTTSCYSFARGHLRCAVLEMYSHLGTSQFPETQMDLAVGFLPKHYILTSVDA